MLSEEALVEGPALSQVSTLLQAGMHPVHGDTGTVVLDAVACLRIVADDLASADAALRVNLVEDGVLGLGDAEPVELHQALDGLFRKEGLQEGDEVGFRVEADGLLDELDGKHGNFLLGRRCWRHLANGFFEPVRSTAPVFRPGPHLGMLFEEVGRGLMVGTGGLVVAAANGGIEDVSGIIDVGAEAEGSAAVGARETRALTPVRR